MDEIYYNGDIITLEKELYKEAIHIKDGKIYSIGKYDKIIKEKEETTKLIDLKGKTLMPSFIDAHSHITGVANTFNIVSLNECKSFSEIINVMKKALRNKKIDDNHWLIGYGYDNNNLVERIHPDKDILNKIATDLPILITHISGHMGVVNDKVLSILSLNNNKSNGYFEESSFFNITKNIPKINLEDFKELLIKAEKEYLKNGITTVQDGLMKELEFEELKYATQNHKFNIDIVGYIDMKNSINLPNKEKKYLKKYINRLKIGGYKLILDGSPQARTAWVKVPYRNTKEYGIHEYDDEKLEYYIDFAYKENMQVLVHCNGDAAADQYIRVLDKVQKKYNKDIRPVMIHAQILRYDQLSKIKKLGIILSFFVAHVYYFGDIHIKNLGISRARKISCVNSSIKNNILFTFHQDSPVVKPDMLNTIWCAVKRKTKNNVTLGKNEKINVLDAIKAVTINSAKQYFEEDIKGSLKKGKLADMIILDKNPLKCDENEIKDIKILKTIKEGKVVYDIEKMV